MNATATTASNKPADLIRAALKAKGINRKQVSVRHSHYSMGSSIRIHILDPKVKLSEVKAIAQAHEHVRRDEASGEILNGGNTYLDVEYTQEALDTIASEVVPVLATLTKGGPGVHLFDRKFIAQLDEGNGCGSDYYFIGLSGDLNHNPIRCYGAEFAARSLAQWILDPDGRR